MAATMPPKTELRVVAGAPQNASLVGEVTFATVNQVHEAGLQWLGQAPADTCHLDLSAVTRCDSAALALLMEWLRCARRWQRRLLLREVPEALTAMLPVLGVESLLEPLFETSQPRVAVTNSGTITGSA